MPILAGPVAHHKEDASCEATSGSAVNLESRRRQRDWSPSEIGETPAGRFQGGSKPSFGQLRADEHLDKKTLCLFIELQVCRLVNTSDFGLARA